MAEETQKMWVRLSKWGGYPELPRWTHRKQNGPQNAWEEVGGGVNRTETEANYESEVRTQSDAFVGLKMEEEQEIKPCPEILDS